MSDEGPGIAEAHREGIFEPFYRGAPRSTGAGLGLNLVKQIVEKHGGALTILPRAAGTTFRITLPAPPDREETDSRRPLRLTASAR